MDNSFDVPGAMVRVTGIVRGVDIDQTARVKLEQDSLVLEWADAASPWELAHEGLDGIVCSDSLVTLYLHGGDLLELRGADEIRTLAVDLTRTLHGMPEITRGLRSLGSLRGSPGTAHDRWFAPLLQARRAVVNQSDPIGHVKAFDAATLRAELERAVEEIAVVNAPEGAHRRALEAALEEEVEPVLAAIATLGELGSNVLNSPPDSRLHEWRKWVDQLRTVFAIADERWPACAAVLNEGV
jgi:hypothetical protein